MMGNLESNGKFVVNGTELKEKIKALFMYVLSDMADTIVGEGIPYF